MLLLIAGIIVTRAGPLAKKTAGFIEKETFGNSDPVGFNITPASIALTEIAENIFLSPQAISILDRCDL